MRIFVYILVPSLFLTLPASDNSTDERLLLELRRTNTPKEWYKHLEVQVTHTIYGSNEKNVESFHRLLSRKAYLLAAWCITSYADGRDMKTNDINNVLPKIPCGYAKIVSGIQPSKISFEMRTFSPLVIQTSFLVFELDEGGFCRRSTYVQLCSLLVYRNRRPAWDCPQSRQYCGHRKPWVEYTDYSRTAVALIQWNVRQPSNLTFTFTSIERQIAKVYREHSRVVNVTLDYRGFGLKFATRSMPFVNKWLFHQSPGNILHFGNFTACCYAGDFEIHDGFGNYYLLFQQKIANFSRRSLNIASSFYVATVTYYPNKRLIASYMQEIIRLLFSKHPVKVHFMKVDEISRASNHERLLHAVLGVNISSGGFPNVSFNIRSFHGWTDNSCQFGGFKLSNTITTDTVKLNYDQGPYCSRNMPSAPLIGTLVPRYIVLGGFQYFLVIYAFGPWFNIDIDIAMRQSDCEGLFDPVHLCTSSLVLKHPPKRGKPKVVRYIEGKNNEVSCSVIMQPNKKLAFSLNMFNIRNCIIFQSYSSQVGVTEQHSYEAAMSVDVTVSLVPAYLPENDITADWWHALRVGIIGELNDADNIKYSYQKFYKKVETLTFTSRNNNQNFGLYVSFRINQAIQDDNCSVAGAAYSFVGALNKNSMVADISSSCGKLPFLERRQYLFMYVLKFHVSFDVLKRNSFMYVNIECTCSNSSAFNTISILDIRRNSHSVSAIDTLMEIRHGYPLSFIVENEQNCYFLANYRIRYFPVYALLIFQGASDNFKLFVSKTCMTP